MTRSTLRWIIAILTIITALVHLFLGVSGIIGPGPGMGVLSYLFVLNGLGYLGLLVALLVRGFPFFSTRPALTHWLFILYTAVTFVLYFVFNGFTFGPAAIVAKLAELLLIIALFLHMGATE
jgi:hypothetical protein